MTVKCNTWGVWIAAALLHLTLMTTATATTELFTIRYILDDPTPTTEDRFGESLALNGGRVLIGDIFDDSSGINVGQAHLFDVASGGWLRTFDDPTPTTEDWFGRSVALSGELVAIGAPNDDTHGRNVGQAHLFNASTGELLYTFDDPTPTPEPDDIYGDFFGNSVAVSGNSVLVGAPGHDTPGMFAPGQAHLFDADSGEELLRLDNPSPAVADVFGHSVSLNGNQVLIAAPVDDSTGMDVGQAYLFDADSGAPLATFDDPTPTTEDRLGWRTVAQDANRVLIGSPGDDTYGTNVGQAYLFNTSGDLLRTFDDPTPTNEDAFGLGVALDGNRVLIGARGDGTNGPNVGQAHQMTDAFSPFTSSTPD